MNTISFTPQVSNHTVMKQNRTVFKGIKPQTVTQPKKTVNVLNRLYQMFFVPFGENVVKLKNGNSYTEKLAENNTVLVSTKRRLFGFRPKAVVRDERKTQLRELKTFNKDKTINLEYSDMYTPEYKVSIGYNHLKDKNTLNGMTIQYGDKKVDISEARRKDLMRDMETIIDKKFPETMEDLNNLVAQGKFEEHLKKFFRTPEVIANALLSSPDNLIEQVHRVPRSMPYGIECILDKLAK